MATYTRSVSSDFGGNIDILQFSDIVRNSSIGTNFDGGQVYGDVVELFFSVALTAPQITTLDGLISSYSFNPNYFPFDAVQEIKTIGNGVGLVNYQFGPNSVLYNVDSGSTGLTSVTLDSNTVLIDGSADLVNATFYTISNVQNIFPNSQVLTQGNGITIDANGVISASVGVLGENEAYVEGNEFFNSSKTIFDTAIRLNANNLTSGKYRVAWATRFSSTSNNKSVDIRVRANGVADIGRFRQIPVDAVDGDFGNYSSFRQLDLSGNNYFDFDFKAVDTGSYSAILIDPRIEFWRVA